MSGLNEAGQRAAEQIGIVWRPVPQDGTWHDTPAEGKGRRNGAGRVKLFPDGEGGQVWNWITGDTLTFWARNEATLDTSEREARRKRAEELRRQAEAEREQAAAECRKRAAEMWKAAGPAPTDHPYLTRKGIKPHGARIHDGRLLIPVWGSDGTLHGLQFIDADGSKKFLTGTAKAGNYSSIGGKPNGALYLAEGFATAATIREATGGAVAVAFDCGNLRAVAVALAAKYPDARLIVCGDNDHGTEGNPGKTKASEAAKAAGGWLVIPAFPDGTPGITDLNDLAAVAGLDEVRRQIEGAQHVTATEQPAQVEAGGNDQDTDPPLLFDEIDTPDISPSLLPGWLGEYVDAVARSTQTPPAMAVMLALSTVATCTAKRFEVSPSSNGYSEPLNLWTATAMPPASRKTAVIQAITAPLVEYEKSEGDRLAPAVKAAAIQRRLIEKRVDKLERDAGNAESASDRDALQKEIAKLCDEMPAEVLAPRLWTGDTTPERLQGLLADHGERMAVLTDEGGIFEVMAGLYNDGRVNLDIFLQGHAGQAVRVDRQGRTAHLDAPALSFGLAIQPAVLADMATGGKRKFRGNGTLARFLYAVPRSNIGGRDVRAGYQIPATVAARYRAGLLDLLAIPPQLIDGREVPRRLTLTPDALDDWHAFAEMVEQRQAPDGDLESISDWSGKLPGAALRIAGNLHLVEFGAHPPAQIEAATMERALDLCALLIDHAKAAFALMEADPATADAKALLRWITAGRLARFKRGEAYRHFKGRFTGRPERLDKALRELEARSIVTAATEQTPGRPAKVYSANTALWGPV